MTLRAALLLLVPALLLLALAASAQRPAQDPRIAPRSEPLFVPVGDDARDQALEIYATRCTHCHGSMGQGDGVVARGLSVPPRDLSSAAWQRSVSHGWIEAVILDGGPAVGRSELMPPNPDLKNRPEVLAALRDLVRDLGRPEPGAQ